LAKEIWLSPVLGNNRERLLKRCAEYVSSGQSDRLLYIAASHPLLDLVTERLLDGKSSRGVWGEFPVYLFRGLVRRILAGAVSRQRLAEGAGAPLASTPQVPIDREELPLRRSLISQIVKQLSAAGKLKAIRPLANRDGCVNTIASLIGELERAGKTANEFQAAIELRAEEPDSRFQIPDSKFQGKRHSQIDFDREVALIYQTYTAALNRFGLTDEDADQLRALQVLRGELDEREVALPWLDEIDLLVLDGFFDFTPVQGEILKRLIPAVPNVIVNLSGDERNRDIFRPFQSTLDHLTSIGDFKVVEDDNVFEVSPELAPLREKLFNVAQVNLDAEFAHVDNLRPAALVFECSDRELEISTIAKEIKRLVLTEGYSLSDIGLVVRERAAYVDTILRVFRNESIPGNLERRVEAPHIPAVRACGKLFQLLKDTTTDQGRNPKASDISHLIKTNYFRISPESLDELTKTFDEKYVWLLAEQDRVDPDVSARQRASNRIGRWAPDVLENVIAYVGSELRVSSWIDRALNLIKTFPSPEAAQSLISGSDEPEDPAAVAEDEVAPEDGAALDRQKKPSPVHPAAIAWTVLVMRHLQRLLSGIPDEGSPSELRTKLIFLFDQLRFANQINRPFQLPTGASDVPQATLDVRGLEALRRAVAGAMRSFQYANQVVTGTTPSADSPVTVTLSTFIDEIERCLRSQTLAIGGANRDGLRVLEATDVRGLRFRAIFIAGMIEGGFPLRAGRDWLYPHEERQRLQKHGIFLEDISTDTLLKEEHYFYQAACRATERLYLSRPLTTEDGNETVASHYLEELQRALHPTELLRIQIRNDMDKHELLQSSTSTELSVSLVRQSERHRHRDNREALLPEKQVAALLKRATLSGHLSDSALQRIGIERERNSEHFGQFDGEITNDSLRSMLTRHFGAEYVYSASAISTYGNCAFRFLGQRVLKLQPRSEAALDLQAIDAGKLLHDILRRFFERYRRQYLPGLDREALRADLAKTADQVFKEHARLVPPLNPRIWEIDCEIRKLILDQVLLYELQLQEKTNKRGVLPAYFELAFGRASQASDPKSSTDYLRLARPGKGAASDSGEAALFQGQIDRVDLNEREQIAVAYDYKLTRGAKLDDIRTGREVQIPIYLAALEQIFLNGYNLAGGGYYRLRAASGRLNQGLYRAAFADCTHLSYAKSKLDDIEWQRIRNEVRERVWEFIDGMRGGHFRVKPSLGRLTCKFCDYSAVCRYDPYRISRKRI
jgi:ATP-dependent helicase/nuclease subunit B